MRSNRHHTTSLCTRLENVSDVIDLRDFVRKNGQNLERKKININPVGASSCNSENSSQETFPLTKVYLHFKLFQTVSVISIVIKCVLFIVVRITERK